MGAFDKNGEESAREEGIAKRPFLEMTDNPGLENETPEEPLTENTAAEETGSEN
ncbi:MAG: hypothetical protein H8E46_03755 [FCB group bacterium]|nr:hypothetical protein [FCB group bacterium]